MTRRVVVAQRVANIKVTRQSVIRSTVNKSEYIPIAPKPTTQVVKSPPKPIQSTPVQRQHISGNVVSKRSHLKPKTKTKAAKVQYLGSTADPGSIAKIDKLRNVGVGKILVIIANGPSILEANLEALKGNEYIDTLMINRPYEPVWPTTYWTMYDTSQFKRFEHFWNSYDGVIIHSSMIKRSKSNTIQIANIRGGKTFSKEMNKGICIGNSSTYAAMQIAYWANYNRVYIFGLDMNTDPIDGKHHYYGVNPDMPVDRRVPKFVKEAEYYNHAAAVLTPEEASKFVICSTYNEYPFMNKFPTADQKTAVGDILAYSVELGADIM